MGIEQTLSKMFKRLFGVSGGLEDEKLEEARREFLLHLESLNYNPMLNHVILTKIFKYSTHGDLLRFRVVCKTWHKLVTSHLLLKDPIHRIVTHESDLTKLLSITKNSSAFPIQSFYIKIPSLSAPPHHALFKTLSLPCIVSLKIIIESKHFPGAVKTIGRHMKSLKHLVICRTPEHSFEAIGVSSSPTGAAAGDPPGKLPNLVSLTLRNNKPTRNFLATYDQAVVELIRAASHGSLQCLEFWHWGLLTRILRDVNLAGLKSMRVVGGKLSESDIMVLIGKKGLKLDRFSARVDKSVGKELVKEFLNKRLGERKAMILLINLEESRDIISTK